MECLAKAVALKDLLGQLLAVMPASHDLDLDRLRELLHRPGLELMSEEELVDVFFDCEPGAVPPLGPDYRVPTVVDRALMQRDEVYFEAAKLAFYGRCRRPNWRSAGVRRRTRRGQ